MGHVDPGPGMHFGPVEEGVKGFLIFLAQSPPKLFEPFPFRFRHMADWQFAQVQAGQ
jgi:hypothetical protein